MWDTLRNPTALLTLCWAGLTSVVLAQTPSPPIEPAAPMAVAAQPAPPPAPQSAPNGPPQGIVALRNGEVFQGGVMLAGEEYIVLLPQGELRFKAADVEHCCATMPEVFARKRAGVAPADVLEHLRLAQWCLRHGLFNEAAIEIDDAARLQPEHPILPMLRQRVELLRNPPAPPKDATPGPAKAITSEMLDQMVRGLPDGSMEAFTQRVQPVLLNHCATAGCHGPQSTAKMQLFRTGTATVSRRMTQRNLHAVLPYITRENPAGSPLLNSPTQLHGPAKAAIFTDRESVQFRRLEDWVYHVSGKMPPTAPESISLRGYSRPGGRGTAYVNGGVLEPAAEGQPAPVTIEADTFGAPSSSAVNPAAHLAPKPDAAAKAKKPREVNVVVGEQSPGLSTPSQPATGGLVTKKPGAEPIPATDPFDPELFNRRFAAPPH